MYEVVQWRIQLIQCHGVMELVEFFYLGYIAIEKIQNEEIRKILGKRYCSIISEAAGIWKT